MCSASVLLYVLYDLVKHSPKESITLPILDSSREFPNSFTSHKGFIDLLAQGSARNCPKASNGVARNNDRQCNDYLSSKSPSGHE